MITLNETRTLIARSHELATALREMAVNYDACALDVNDANEEVRELVRRALRSARDELRLAATAYETGATCIANMLGSMSAIEIIRGK